MEQIEERILKTAPPFRNQAGMRNGDIFRKFRLMKRLDVSDFYSFTSNSYQTVLNCGPISNTLPFSVF